LDPEGKELAECPCCRTVMDEPTQGCPEGHVICRGCYTAWVETKKTCPICRRPTDESRSAGTRPLPID